MFDVVIMYTSIVEIVVTIGASCGYVPRSDDALNNAGPTLVRDGTNSF